MKSDRPATILGPMNVSGWLKGNTHTHTARSDGDAPAADAVRWYAQRGYDFLVITDHNRYLGAEELAAIGPVAIQRPKPRGARGGAESKSGPENGSAHDLVLIGGSELSYRSAITDKPAHVCDLGGQGSDPPGNKAVMFDGAVAAAARAAVEAVRRAGGLPIVAHPNWNWALTADDLLAVPGDYLLEIWNPSSACNNVAAGGFDSPEQTWAKLLTAGRRIWAVAADDAHKLLDPGAPATDGGGLAWVRVGSDERSAGAILQALADGRFYASTGVELEELDVGPGRYRLKVRQAGDRKYTIRFLGPGDRILRTVYGTEAEYRIGGGEGFVRAAVEDSQGDRCWAQPAFV